MKLAMASEVCSFGLLEEVKQHLLEQGHEVIDLGMQSADEPMVFYETAPRVVAATCRFTLRTSPICWERSPN